MESPETRVRIAENESGRLKEYLASLSEEDWNKPSACQRWTVRDLVAHMAWVAESYTNRIHQSLRGEAVPADGSPPPEPILAANFADSNVDTAVSRSNTLGQGVLADFVTQDDDLIRMMKSLSGDNWDLPHYYASLGTVPMRYRPDLWISELAMHGWDIRSRLEPDVHLSPMTLPACADVVPGQLMHFLFNPRAPLEPPLRHRWRLSGVGAREVDVVIFGDRVEVGPSKDATVDVALNSDTETYVMVSWQRLGMGQAVDSGQVSVEGDEQLASELMGWFWGG